MTTRSTRVPLRWVDFDGLGHVHHGAVLTILEAGRDVFLKSIAIGGADYVIRRIEIDYLGEIPEGTGAVDITSQVESLGRSSIVLGETISVDGSNAVVRARVVIVLWDSAEHNARELTPAERAALEPLITARAESRKESNEGAKQ